jgi:anti-sigma factor RsiW
MNTSQHIDELAELYALGSLEEPQRALVDAHVRMCEACAGRLGEAEATVVALIEPGTPSASLDRRVHAAFVLRSPWRWTAPLVAAAFVLGLLPSMLLWSSVSRNAGFDTEQTQAVQAMVNSHFAHAPFVQLSADAPKAKLIYSRTADWRYVVAQTDRAYDVAAKTNGRTIVLGQLRVRGNAGELFVTHAPASREFLLLDGSRAVGRVTLPYRP